MGDTFIKRNVIETPRPLGTPLEEGNWEWRKHSISVQSNG